MRSRRRSLMDGITVVLCYRPRCHSLECLENRLEALTDVTELPLSVLVVVQGCWRTMMRDGKKLPPSGKYPFKLNYTLNDVDFGDADVMGRTLAACRTRYWSFMSHDVLLPPHGLDAMLRCLRNEDRRKDHKVAVATMACVDREADTPLLLESGQKVVTVSSGSRAERSEEFAIWDVCDYVAYGPVVVMRARLENAGCCFDRNYAASGHWMDFSMQLQQAGLHVVRVQQPGTQLHLGCIDDDHVASVMPDGDAPVFQSKWRMRCMDATKKKE
jgi:hypothetical protein